MKSSIIDVHPLKDAYPRPSKSVPIKVGKKSAAWKTRSRSLKVAFLLGDITLKEAFLLGGVSSRSLKDEFLLGDITLKDAFLLGDVPFEEPVTPQVVMGRGFSKKLSLGSNAFDGQQQNERIETPLTIQENETQFLIEMDESCFK
tara:strand:+ start:34 stop:468 length:435 start_codon:yes stop_codon:yes gene_type:complete